MTNNDYIEWGRQYWANVEPEDAGLHAALGIGSEAGEIQDLYKKNLSRGIPVTREQLIDELGDLLYYIARQLDVAKSSFEEVMAKNQIKLNYRMKHGKNKEVEFKLQQEYYETLT